MPAGVMVILVMYTLRDVGPATWLPAVLGLAERGLVREGYFADLVLLDPDRVVDAADYDDPVAPSLGIALVMVNGGRSWNGGAAADAGVGRVLRR